MGRSRARDAIGVRLNYQSVGSGAGINQVRNRTVDFGATDAPLSAAQLAEAKLLQFPTVMGSWCRSSTSRAWRRTRSG